MTPHGPAFRLEVATLSASLFSGEVTYVEVPGLSGYLGVLKGHEPLLTLVAPGALMIYPAEGAVRTLEVSGGMVEVGPWGVTVLADQAGRDAQTERRRMAQARRQAAVHLPYALRPVGAEAVKAELDADLVRFFAQALPARRS